MAYRFDLSQWPVAVLVISGELDDDLDGMFAKKQELFARGRHVAIWFEENDVHVSAKGRKYVTHWITDNQEAMRESLIAEAYVLRSAITRGVLTAIFWVRPLSCPTKVFSSLSDAIDWAKAEIQAMSMV